MRFKILRLSLFLLIIFNFTSTEEVVEENQEEEGKIEGEETEEDKAEKGEKEEAEEEAPTCNEELLNSYGLMGKKFKEPMEMHICTGVKESCCKLEDQLAIYDQLTKGEELPLMEERFKYHRKVRSNEGLR